MPKAKLFMNGRSQAVRLPKEFRFSGTSVNIERVGDTVVLSPEKPEEAKAREKYDWGPFFEALDQISPDFMENGREQPTEQQDRTALWEFIDQLEPDLTVEDLNRPPPMEPEDLFD